MLSAYLVPVVFYVLPMVRSSGQSATEMTDCENMELGPCRKVIKSPLLDAISEKMSDKQPQYNCTLEDAALGHLLLGADADFYLDLFPQANGTKQLQYNETKTANTPITRKEAKDFVIRAVESWSSELQEMKAKKTNTAKYGCNFAVDVDKVEKGFKYTLLCLFS